jgi:hypothetical protein
MVREHFEASATATVLKLLPGFEKVAVFVRM